MQSVLITTDVVSSNFDQGNNETGVPGENHQPAASH
jgi:hypothetical protein